MAWAHTIKARLVAEPTSIHWKSSEPQFVNSHNWMDPRKKLFSDNHSKDSYFGNTIAVVSTDTPSIKCANDLVEACNWTSTPTEMLDIVEAIMKSNWAVDEEFVLTWTAPFVAMDDIRQLGL